MFWADLVFVTVEGDLGKPCSWLPGLFYRTGKQSLYTNHNTVKAMTQLCLFLLICLISLNCLTKFSSV